MEAGSVVQLQCSWVKMKRRWKEMEMNEEIKVYAFQNDLESQPRGYLILWRKWRSCKQSYCKIDCTVISSSLRRQQCPILVHHLITLHLNTKLQNLIGRVWVLCCFTFSTVSATCPSCFATQLDPSLFSLLNLAHVCYSDGCCVLLLLWSQNGDI